MNQPMILPLPQPGPAKAIPPARDRLQSQLLIAVAALMFAWLSVLAVRYCLALGQQSDHYSAIVVGASILFALVAWRLRAATPLAALFGGAICLQITAFSSNPRSPVLYRSGLIPLLLLFVVTFLATRAGKRQKISKGLAESRRGRNAAQVTANLGVAALASFYTLHAAHLSGWGPFALPLAQIPMLAALAEATADTVSSELGQAFGGTPFMLTTLRRAPPGTDGAISLKGTLAGIAAAAIIAATGAPTLGMSTAQCALVFMAAVAGLFFDSLLGATVERRGYLGNDLVNFVSTLFAALAAVAAQRLCS